MTRSSFFIFLLSAVFGTVLLASEEEPFFESDAWIHLENHGIAAKVEGRIITFGEIRREMAPLLPQLQRRVRTQEEFERAVNQLGRDVLQNMIDQILIVENFRSQNFSIPKSILESEFNDTIANDFDNNRARFLEYLRSQDMTVKEFRERLEERIIVQVMRQRQRRSMAEISPERIAAFYEENADRFRRENEIHLRQIVLTPRANEPLEEREALAAQLHERLTEGSSFADLAAEYSRDDRARHGGDWGWMKQSDLRSELAAAAFALKTGDFSAPVSIGNTVFILYAEERREAGVKPLSEVRETIEQLLSEQIARETQRRWIDRLRDRAFIEFYI